MCMISFPSDSPVIYLSVYEAARQALPYFTFNYSFPNKAQVLVPHTDWGARFTPPPTERRSVEELPQWPRERERESVCVCVFLSACRLNTHVQPSQLLRHNPWMHKEREWRKKKRKSRGCRIYLKRSGEHVSKAGWDLVLLSLSRSVSLLLPFSGNLRGSAGIAERAQRESIHTHLDFHPCRVGNVHTQWERVCERLPQDFHKTHTQTAAPAGHSQAMGARLLWPELIWEQCPREHENWMQRPEHMFSRRRTGPSW